MTVTENLDPKSGQIKEVFAYFGLAAYNAQCLERQVAVTLATRYGPDPTRITKRELEAIYDDLFSKTLGQLVREIKELRQLSKDEEKRLTEALEERNRLIHRYFWERATDFMSEAGRASMIQELQEVASLLDTVDAFLTQEDR